MMGIEGKRRAFKIDGLIQRVHISLLLSSVGRHALGRLSGKLQDCDFRSAAGQIHLC